MGNIIRKRAKAEAALVSLPSVDVINNSARLLVSHMATAMTAYLTTELCTYDFTRMR